MRYVGQQRQRLARGQGGESEISPIWGWEGGLGWEWEECSVQLDHCDAHVGDTNMLQSMQQAGRLGV